MTRYFFLLTLIFASSAFGQSNNNKLVRVNERRIEEHIQALAMFGKDSLGRGYRVAFSKGDIAGRAYVMNLLQKAGLETSIDFAGNIIGKRKGSDPTKKTIAFGSHIDMVPDGGNYDGCVGSLGALEVIETLNEHKMTTTHPLQLIIFCDEEGGTVGSRAIAGELDNDALNVVTQSKLSIREGINAIGGNADRVKEAAIKKGTIAAFLELHIEQGGILEKEKIQIGVVEGIVGIEHWQVTVDGFANHAGTTPMNSRKDALLAAAKFIIAVNEVVTGFPGRQVGTVGKIAVEPGAPNVIPGKCTMTLELRDLSAPKIDSVVQAIKARAATIASASGTSISFKHLNVAIQPALTNKSLQGTIAAAAQQLGLSYRLMQSGAGHDSQEMSRIAPVGMIFIPSVNGISHSPKEYATAADMANGANVLLQSVLQLDRQ